MYQDVLEHSQSDLIAPLIAIAWPRDSAEELIRFYEAFAMLLSEDFDLLILYNAEQSPDEITQHLESLNVSEERLIFMECDIETIDVKNCFEFCISQNADGAENISVTPKTYFRESVDSVRGAEYLIAGPKVFVPIYEASQGEEALMEISQKFSTKEVVALHCECLSELDLTLSDLVLFSKQ